MGTVRQDHRHLAGKIVGARRWQHGEPMAWNYPNDADGTVGAGNAHPSANQVNYLSSSLWYGISISIFRRWQEAFIDFDTGIERIL